MMALTMLAHGSVEFDKLPGPERQIVLRTLQKEIRPYHLTITCAYNPHCSDGVMPSPSLWNVRAPKDRNRGSKAIALNMTMNETCLFIFKLIEAANKYKEQCNADT